MNSSAALTTTFLGLALSATALAQAPSPGEPSYAPGLPPPQNVMASAVTQSSRIRAFNPGPDGQVRSLYLSNGSVVDLPPDLGRTLGTAVRKGKRISVSGFRSNVNGQTILAANRLILNGQTFLSQPGATPLAGANRLPPPPPPAGRDGGPDRRGGVDMARLGPQVPGADGRDPRPGSGQAPPPPPCGPRAGRPQGTPPPPPPPANGGQRSAPIPPPADPNAPAPLNAPNAPAGAPPAQPVLPNPAQPASPNTPPVSYGPAPL